MPCPFCKKGFMTTEQFPRVYMDGERKVEWYKEYCSNALCDMGVKNRYEN